MSKQARYFNILRDLLVLAAIEAERLEVPKWRFDGEEAKAEDVAAELLIPIEEAAVRLDGPMALKHYRVKDVHSGSNSHSVDVGVGTTIQQRIGRFIARRDSRRKKRKKKNDGSSGK